jgi:serine/threonine-protein kinase
MSDNAQFRALLRRWQDLQQQGRPVAPEQLCADFPELLPKLKEFIAGQAPSTSDPRRGDSAVSLVPSTVGEGRLCEGPTHPRPAFPRHIAGYEILGILGRGGMGVVYKARHPTLGIDVALKTMHFEADAAGLADRFLREAQAVVRLNHPNIVRLYEAGQAEGGHYFTMACVAGGTLYQRRQEFTGDARRVAALLEKVARGVEHAHERGIIHRDLKPGNILLDEHGEPLVSDFGLAKFLREVSETTASGVVLGTAAYMAPEQAAGHNRRVGPHSDVWALGVILYELLTGRKPFPGQELVQTLHDIQTHEPPRPSSVNRRLNRALETIVLKCLQKDPGKRYPSAGPLADDLGRWLRGEPILARPEPWPARAWHKLQRRPWRQTSLLTAAVLAAVVVTLAFQAPPPAPERARDPDPAHTPLRTGVVQDRDAALRHLQASLARGEEVQLLDGAGMPKWSRWLLGQESLKPVSGKQQAFAVHTLVPTLLELMPDPFCEHYEFQAKVQQTDGFEEGTVGLFCGYSQQPIGVAKHHFVMAWHFSEVGVERGWVKLHLFDLVESQDGTLGVARKGLPVSKEFPAASALPGPWHLLTVVVGPQKWVVKWDGTSVGEVPRSAVESRTKSWIKGLKLVPAVPPPAFQPREPLGLLVWRGAASFAEVTIKPLHD